MAFQPIVFGEVLFDIFEHDQAVLGGAPFNVAWHLQGFGMSPVFISRVGRDAYGQQIQTAMQDWGMITSGLQLDDQYQTGRVQVSLLDGQPHFDILPDMAYDHIDATEAVASLTDIHSSLFYHGSLVARTEYSSRIVKSLRAQAGTIFTDINLRSPWWTQQQVEELVRHVDILKVNDDELATLMSTGTDLEQLEAAAKAMQKRYQLKQIIVTRGEKGAFSISNDKLIHCSPVKVDNLLDTVGAGDGFSAVCIVGHIYGWDKQTTLERATGFAAQICQQRGATSNDPAMYQHFKNKWMIS